MKFDMHCHTLEGSPDASVSLVQVIEMLKDKGYNGMLVTDHNTYKGYNSLKEKTEDFIVIKGIEYDTIDGGHMLIILPSDIDCKLLTIRGMTLQDTINTVHRLGGIIGPAHPFDYYRMGMCNNPIWVSKFDTYSQLDFIESFNACGRDIGNLLSDKLANFIDKPKFGGSDSHRLKSTGLGYTLFSESITNVEDLIRLIKAGNSETTEVGGVVFHDAMINKHKLLFGIGAKSYTVLNTLISKHHKKRILLLIQSLNYL